MLIDFQQHYTPPELLKGEPGKATADLDRDGNPHYLLNPLLADLGAHIRMMDAAGIDAGVLTCGAGFDQPDIAVCRLINDRLREVERAHPGRFIGLAHVPALKATEAAAELKRCAVELGFPGAVIASELQGLPLDAQELRPFWKTCADLGLYVFIHPLPRVIRWSRMDADDLGRMLGWEFSLMIAAVRLINSGLLDELPTLKIQFSHFAGGIGRYLGRIRGFQARDKWGTRNSSVTAAARASRSTIISIIACITISPAGPGRTTPPNLAGNGCASVCRKSRARNSYSPPIIRRPCASQARSQIMSRRCVRLARRATQSPVAPTRRSSSRISNGGLLRVRRQSRYRHERQAGRD